MMDVYAGSLRDPVSHQIATRADERRAQLLFARMCAARFPDDEILREMVQDLEGEV